MIINENVSLLNYNTFGIDANARYFVEYSSANELMDILQSDIFKTNKFLHIGCGSNLLFTHDFDGIILHSAERKITVLSENDTDVIIEATAGVIWDDLVAFCVEKKMGGIENLSGIPGETGAAAVQNIGAYGVEIKDVVKKVNTFDTQKFSQKEFNVDECEYGYRSSIFKKRFPGRYIITSVQFKLSKKNVFQLGYQHLEDVVKNYGDINLENIRKAVLQIRNNKLPDPKLQGNAGSFFMNPVVDNHQFMELLKRYQNMPYYRVSNDEVKIPAAWLIEQCGFKGRTLGNAGVHPQHALIIVNLGKSSADNIVLLANEITYAVEQKFNIKLLPEVIYI
jgi:UDP-N-acetylmuramate dehydrogenase